MKLEPVARQSLVNVVAERIRGLIDAGNLDAGTRLPGELELVEQLQVSRPVLREAISRLESVGLIEVRRGQGMFVGTRGSLTNCLKLLSTAMRIAPKDLTRIAELRTAIECHAARLAAERATPADVAELETICDNIDRRDQEPLEAIRWDFEFHRKIVTITGNELMQYLMQVIHEFVMASMLRTTPQPRNHLRSQALHQAIVAAIRAGDAAAAATAMAAHMAAVDAALRAAED